MIKWIWVIVLIFSPGLAAEAQIFGQKGKQRKLLIQQIALLQTYMGYVKKGYQVVDGGIRTVNGIKNGEWNLHRLYLESLRQVNPRVRSFPQVSEVIRYGTRIDAQCRSMPGALNTSGKFSAAELDYIRRVYLGLVDRTSRQLDYLAQVIEDGHMELSDDERLQRIADIYKEVTSLYRFTVDFSNQVRMLAGQRGIELKETEVLQGIYELK